MFTSNFTHFPDQSAFQLNAMLRRIDELEQELAKQKKAIASLTKTLESAITKEKGASTSERP